ncbi:MAG: ABC transporter substrate-binding protein [Alphaproteobacteria bacterium]
MIRLICLLTVFLSSLAAAKDVKLALDWFVNPDHAPIILAKQLGIFEKHNLNVDVIAPSDPSQPPKLVAAKAMDMAVSYQPQLHLQRYEGLPLSWAGTLVATPLNCLLVVKDGPIKQLADLQGKRVGYSVSGFESAMLAQMLKHAKLSADDVEMINVNWALSPSLMSGQVDAVIGAFRNFELTQMRLEGVEGRCFYPEEHGVPPYDELIFVVHEQDAQAQWVQRFMAAIEEATMVLINNPERCWQQFIKAYPDLDDALNRQAWKDTLPRFALRPAAFDENRYKQFSLFLSGHGLIGQVQESSELRGK